MTISIFLLLFFSASQALAISDPVTQCRNDYANDASAHIECLEAALTSFNEYSEQPPNSAEPGTTTTTGVSSVATAVPARADLGAEQIRNTNQGVDEQTDRMQVGIISTSYDSRGFGTFQIENGQIWRETVPSPERQRLDPDEQYSARIERSRFGGYRMYIDGKRWMITVKRVE